MARVQDYDTLCQAIQDYTHRATLAPFLDYFIQDAEDAIYRLVLELNAGSGLSWMEASLTGTMDTNGYVSVPTDYLALKGAQVEAAGGQFSLEMKDSQWIYDNYPIRSAQGIPSFIAREQSNFIFGPFPDSGYTIAGTYYQRASALSASNSTTWMTTNMPLALLAGCMVSASKFLKDDQALQRWSGDFTTRLTAIVDAEKIARLGEGLQIAGGSPLPAGW